MRVLIGSRNLDKAQAAASEIAAQAGAGEVTGHTNPDAVSKAADRDSHCAALRPDRDPQIHSRQFCTGRNPGGCHGAARNCHRRPVVSHADLCGTDQPRSKRRGLRPRASRWSRLFTALSAEALAKLDQPLDCDALICGDSAEAKAAVSELAETIPGVRAIDAGPLDNARFLENAAALAHRTESATQGKAFRVCGSRVSERAGVRR